MTEIDWQKITPGNLELITLRLVEAMGFDEPKMVSGSNDRGEDIIAFHPTTLPGIGLRKRKWVFQCKRVKQLSKKDIRDELANFDPQSIDTWMLVATYRPTPEFRRWFDELEQQYHFHIEAWWKDELEKYIKDYSGRLNALLPEDICNLLKISGQKMFFEEDIYKKIQARFRLQAIRQIEKYAKSKYIPKLYVERVFQKDISKFLSPEFLIAEKIKSISVEMLETAAKQLLKFPSDFHSKTKRIKNEIANHEQQIAKRFSRKNLVDESSVKEKEAILELIKTKKEQLLLRQNLTKYHKKLTVFIEGIVERINESLVQAKALPESYYFKSIDEIYNFLQGVKDFVIFIEDKLKEFNQSRHKLPPESNPNPEISMLSDDNFIYSFKDSLTNNVTSIENLLKNTLIFIDRAGSGKTNLICHTVNHLSSQELVLLIFGKETFSGGNLLIEYVKENISVVLDGKFENSIEEFDKILEKEGKFLTVFIDGINENRNIQEFDSALVSYLNFSSGHRIRNIITCRDIYWDFFSVEEMNAYAQQIFRDKLNKFSDNEYQIAVPLYLDHYNIECRLTDEAREACHHPLLLRFFCEAHGEVNSHKIFLGEVKDIRLKELFDLYLVKKTEQIRKLLGHRNSDIVNTYLIDLASFMFSRPTIPLTTNELNIATGETDTTTTNSLYIRLLDEDIIIEEKPFENILTRQINFVYEEFMEYLMARAILNTPERFRFTDVEDIFDNLNNLLETWVNARGIGEYIALILLAEDYKNYSRADAVNFLSKMANGAETWSIAFWSVIGKAPLNVLDADIFDLFFNAIDSISNIEVIKKTLELIYRKDMDGCHTLATKILWSSALPQVVSWRQINSLAQTGNDDLERLCFYLASIRRKESLPSSPGRINFKKILEAITPFLKWENRAQIENAVRIYGYPMKRVNEKTFIRLFWKVFPENYLYLINGLFSNNEEVREFCADKLQFCKSAQPQIAYICEKLSELEDNYEIKDILKSSVKYLRAGLKTRNQEH